MTVRFHHPADLLKFLTITAVLLCLSVGFCNGQSGAPKTRPRIVVTADPELDDNNSLIRLLLYSDELQIEGLIYASSGFHWKGDGKGTKWSVPGREYTRFGLNLCPCESWRWARDERFIHDVVQAYAKAYPNLKVHRSGYPAPAELLSKVRYGNIDFDGDISKDSPGSDLIKSLTMDEKPGQLFLTAWGGHSTIARALKSIQQQYEYTTAWEAIQKKISRKVVLLPSGDQDDTYATYIRPNWPGIEYRQFSGGPNYSYGAQIGAKPQNAVYLTASWLKEHVLQRGPLGALYRVWGDGKQMVKGDKLDYFGLTGHSDEELKKMGYVVWMPVQAQGSWLGEGDNHTFMNMLGNGLRAYEAGSYGGWGGRGRNVKNGADAGLFSASPDTSAKAMATALSTANRRETADAAGEYPDFFAQAQLDFAARLAWSVTEKYAAANHQPIVKMETPLVLMASPGQNLRLNGAVSDPDGDPVSIRWWQFRVGTYPGQVQITSPESAQAQVKIPDDAAGGQTIHIILEATDRGTPALSSYQRVVITVREK